MRCDASVRAVSDDPLAGFPSRRIISVCMSSRFVRSRRRLAGADEAAEAVEFLGQFVNPEISPFSAVSTHMGRSSPIGSLGGGLPITQAQAKCRCMSAVSKPNSTEPGQQVTRLRPARFASYKALSATLINLGRVVVFGDLAATPILMVARIG